MLRMLLDLTTIRRLMVVLLVFLAWTPAAYAWSWPVQGPVLRQFSYDEAHPYAAGQHRGIDIGADAAGGSVVAPEAGTVSFAGTVPTNGKSVTIETADGYSVTLTHLGSILVAKGATVAERDPVGTVGPSGTPEVDGPYVHLGIRHTDDPNGYLDPLTLLPPPAGAPDGGSTVTQPSSSTATSNVPQTTPASSPAASAAAATAGGSTLHLYRRRAPQQKDVRRRTTRVSTQPQRVTQRPAAHHATSATRARASARVPHRRPSEPAGFSQRPAVETEAHAPTVLDAGHEIRPSVRPSIPAPGTTGLLVPLICNGAAALVALAAAFAAARGRRREAPSRGEGAPVLQLPERTLLRRAA